MRKLRVAFACSYGLDASRDSEHTRYLFSESAVGSWQLHGDQPTPDG